MNLLISQFKDMPPEFGAHIGLVKAPIDIVASELVSWRKDLGFGPMQVSLNSGLADNANTLLPVAPLPVKRELLVATRGGEWTAYFTSGFRGGDPRGPISVIGSRLSAATLTVAAIPFRGSTESVGSMLGSCVLEYVPTGIPRVPRSIALVEGESDSSRYRFETYGPEQPWEDIGRYLARQKKDRIDPELIERYCRELGVDVFDLDFYSGPCVYIERTRFQT